MRGDGAGYGGAESASYEGWAWQAQRLSPRLGFADGKLLDDGGLTRPGA
jgi:hypothetical protein